MASTTPLLCIQRGSLCTVRPAVAGPTANYEYFCSFGEGDEVVEGQQRKGKYRARADCSLALQHDVDYSGKDGIPKRVLLREGTRSGERERNRERGAALTSSTPPCSYNPAQIRTGLCLPHNTLSDVNMAFYLSLLPVFRRLDSPDLPPSPDSLTGQPARSHWHHLFRRKTILRQRSTDGSKNQFATLVWLLELSRRETRPRHGGQSHHVRSRTFLPNAIRAMQCLSAAHSRSVGSPGK